MEIKNLITQILFTLYVFTIKRAICQRPYVIEFDSLQYEYNREHVKVCDMKIVKYNNHSALNATIIFSHDVNDFYMDLKVLVPKGKRHPWVFLNTTVNGCEFLKGMRNKILNFANIFYNELKQADGFPTKCPVEKDKPIYVPNLYIDSKKYPPYLPVFNTQASLVSRGKHEYFYRVNVSLVIVDKKNERFK